jgi:hypothetical protein
MESKITFNLEPNNTDSDLSVEVWLDQKQLFNFEKINCLTPVTINIDDSDSDHELHIILKNKTNNDTVVDESGNILKDKYINIKNFNFDDIDIDQIITETATYTHNFNGNRDRVVDKFYGTMGCNGTVSLKFTTPVYLWLLENM